MNLQRLADLRKIMNDAQVPMSTRMNAASKYQAELDRAAVEAQAFIESIRHEAADQTT